MPGDLHFNLSPTQTRFVLSDSHIVQLMGPMGEGKTFAGVAGMIAHAQRCQRDIRFAIIRDTFENIKTSTKPDIEEYLKNWAQFSDGGHRLHIPCKPSVTCDLFGIDDERSISKLQGPQYGGIWLEEPAPIYEKANAGLPIGVFRMAIARAARQRGTVIRVQITQNPADEEHWTSLLVDEPYEYATYVDPKTGKTYTVYKEVFSIPAGENKHLSGLTRAANVAAFQDDPAKMARYVKGEIATVHLGRPVTPGYSPRIHYSPHILPVFPGQLIQMWDSWQHPCCLLAQYAPTGQLILHDCCYGEGLGVKELIEEQLEPMLATPKYKGKAQSWRILGDRTMKIADQSSVNSVTSRIIEEKFKIGKNRFRFEPGPAHWRTMKEPLNASLKKLLNGGIPMVYLSRSCTRLHRALKGGWHYKTDNNGKVIGQNPKPVKDDQHNHPGDAFANGISVLLPGEKKTIREKQQSRNKKYPGGYGGGEYARPAMKVA